MLTQAFSSYFDNRFETPVAKIRFLDKSLLKDKKIRQNTK